MDSFYDAPRRPPAPVYTETLSVVPVVPEISVLCPSNTPRNAFMPYNQWRQNQHSSHNNFFGPNKENNNGFMQNPQNNSILKKQVRFENSASRGAPHVTTPSLEQNVKPPSNIYGADNTETGIPSFEQMYMANIPSRQLDLSIIDIPKKAPQNNDYKTGSQPIKGEQQPKTYKEFLESQKQTNKILLNDSVTDIFNYRGNSCDEDAKISPSEKLEEKIPGVNIKNNYNNTDYISISKKPEVYFQGVSQAISQRPVLDKLEQSSNKILMQNHLSATTPPKLNDNSVKNIESYKHLSESPLVQNSESASKKTKCDCCKKLPHNEENNALKLKSDDDFTTKDLLKIIAQQSQQIAQQNTQLLLLQQQISELISMQKNNENLRPKDNTNGQIIHCCQNSKHSNAIRQIQAVDPDSMGGNKINKVHEKCITSTQHEFANGEPKNMNHLPNFSIGLTTSFEVSFRKPAHKNQAEFLPPKIQEITETESIQTEDFGGRQKLSEVAGNENNNKETLMDASMVFKEPIRVREPCPSPEPSIKINMNDFEDSDSEEDEASQIEANFYRNLMTQVNKILQKAQIETAEEITCNMAQSNLNNKTMHKVKEATLKHLKKIGVNLPHIEEGSQSSNSSDETEGKSYNQDEISFAVKQLLLKYLPADHLAKLASKDYQQSNQINLTPKDKIGAIRNRPEFSFATVQYMKKYNLIANRKDFSPSKRQNPSQSPKILDISKLKQQPKLL